MASQMKWAGKLASNSPSSQSRSIVATHGATSGALGTAALAGAHRSGSVKTKPDSPTVSGNAPGRWPAPGSRWPGPTPPRAPRRRAPVDGLLASAVDPTSAAVKAKR